MFIEKVKRKGALQNLQNHLLTFKWETSTPVFIFFDISFPCISFSILFYALAFRFCFPLSAFAFRFCFPLLLLLSAFAFAFRFCFPLLLSAFAFRFCFPLLLSAFAFSFQLLLSAFAFCLLLLFPLLTFLFRFSTFPLLI